MRHAIAAALCIITATAASAQTSTFQLRAFLSARGIRVESEPSWTEGGRGRFDVGATAPGDKRTRNVDVAQIGFDWKPLNWLLIHADGLARHEPSGTIGKRSGLVQAFADVGTEKLRLRAGAFWLPTSRENVDPLWNSRYTITYSALNTWIGQEVRPVGADLQYAPNFYVTAGVTAFRANDTMGTVLADRGWTLGNRLSVYNEDIAVPPPDSLTKPIGDDLDHRNGYAERLRVQMPERAMLQVTHIDNRATLVPGAAPEIPWRTKFNIIGGEIGSTSPTTLVAEWTKGDTTVAFPGGTFTLNFNTAYLLLSHKTESDRFSARVERFETKYTGEDDRNRAFTVAWLRDANPHVRYGAEYTRVTGDGPVGSTITLELRLAYY